MSSWHTVRLVLLMLLVGGVSVASYVYYEHQLHFCVFFSLVIVLVIITHLVYVYSRSIRRMLRMIESIRYGDFTLSFTAKGQNLQEKKMVEDINQVMAQFRAQLSEKEEKHRYFETLLDTVDTRDRKSVV